MSKYRISRRREYASFASSCRKKRVEQLELQLAGIEGADPVYQRRSELFSLIQGALPKELGQIILEYDALEESMLALRSNFFYENGFWDGIALMRALQGQANW